MTGALLSSGARVVAVGQKFKQDFNRHVVGVHELAVSEST